MTAKDNPGEREEIGARTGSNGAEPERIANFRIIKLLGRGGMGSAYLAYDTLMNRTVALKVLSGIRDSCAAERTARFLSEAMLTGRLTHVGIVPIYQVGFEPEHGYYYSMRYLKGRSLDEMLLHRDVGESAFQGGRPSTRLLDVFLRVCEAVGHAHGLGIIHRDLKPSNVMVTDANEVLVLDWGLAKDLRTRDPLDEIGTYTDDASIVLDCRHGRETAACAFLALENLGNRAGAGDGPAALREIVKTPASGDPLTADGIFMGTPLFMSPEQMIPGREMTPASDVYSLGVILYLLLTGEFPVKDLDVNSLFDKVRHGRIRPITQNPQACHLPQVLCAIVDRCLALGPDKRYSDAEKLAFDIRMYLEGRMPITILVRAFYGASCGQERSALSHWEIKAGSVETAAEGIELRDGALLQSRQRSPGDFRCSLVFMPFAGPWRMSVILDAGIGDALPGRHEVRISQSDRSYIELLWMGKRVQRGFDVRFQAGQKYRLEVFLVEDFLRVLVDGNPAMDHRLMFSQTGGLIILQVGQGRVLLSDFEWLSRGAPLHLSYQSLPDRYYLAGDFTEACRLYRQMAESHPDREEGLLALYKEGLCRAEMGETQDALIAFSRLKGTMLDFRGALGAARLEMTGGDAGRAWKKLKNGYLCHTHPEARSEIWFALLDMLETIDDGQWEKKIGRFLELLKDLDPAPQEASQVAFELLDLARRREGDAGVRREAERLLRRHGDNLHVAAETLLMLWRAGIDARMAGIMWSALDTIDLDPGKLSSATAARLLIMRAELCLGKEDIAGAERTLTTAIDLRDQYLADRLWARNWLLLCAYLNDDFSRVIAEAGAPSRSEDGFSSDPRAYRLVLTALALFAKGDRDAAQRSLAEARQFTGWWSQVAGAALDSTPPRILQARHANPNLDSEGLFITAEIHLRLGNRTEALDLYDQCIRHPCNRLMTSALSRVRRDAAAAGRTVWHDHP